MATRADAPKGRKHIEHLATRFNTYALFMVALLCALSFIGNLIV